MEEKPTIDSKQKFWSNLRIILSILAALLLFLFAINLMVASLQHLGRNAVQTILLATSNPFAALFIGLLTTAMLQSSSTTTSLVVALVASGSITLQSAVPIIMGANVGTTITSTIVSLGFINKKKEFKRAVAAGTYHDFFNILTVIILFPLEYHYGFLSNLSEWIGNLFSPSSQADGNDSHHVSLGFSSLVNFLLSQIQNAFVWVLFAMILLFGSILIFRKLISDLLKAKSPEAFSRFFFRSPMKSFCWGLLTTAAIRSSTITTSVVVPIVAKKVATLRQAAPFIMGANIGTTITAFIAVALNNNTSSAIHIAIAHLLFNLIGVILFFPIPLLGKLPIKIASSLGKLTLKYRLAGFMYLLLTFFIIPFSLIYLNQNKPKTIELTYKQWNRTRAPVEYNVLVQFNEETLSGQWSRYEKSATEPSLIYPVYVKGNSLMIGSEAYVFNPPGFCRVDENTSAQRCVESIKDNVNLANQRFDSVYVIREYNRSKADSSSQRYLLSSKYNIILQRELLNSKGNIIQLEKLIEFNEK